MGDHAIRFPYSPLLCCEVRISDVRFSAARGAVKGDGALRRSSNGRAFGLVSWCLCQEHDSVPTTSGDEPLSAVTSLRSD